ncbi:MAG: VOC family protein [Anaerolineales bacterium]
MKKPVHFEVLAQSPVELAEFYTAVFDWEVQVWGDEQTYWLVKTGPESEPGIDGAFMGPHFDQRVINTIEVESLENTLDRIKAQGGRVVHGPNEVPNVGMHAYCADPEGILFGVMEAFPEA